MRSFRNIIAEVVAPPIASLHQNFHDALIAAGFRHSYQNINDHEDDHVFHATKDISNNQARSLVMANGYHNVQGYNRYFYANPVTESVLRIGGFGGAFSDDPAAPVGKIQVTHAKHPDLYKFYTTENVNLSENTGIEGLRNALHDDLRSLHFQPSKRDRVRYNSITWTPLGWTDRFTGHDAVKLLNQHGYSHHDNFPSGVLVNPITNSLAKIKQQSGSTYLHHEGPVESIRLDHFNSDADYKWATE